MKIFFDSKNPELEPKTEQTNFFYSPLSIKKKSKHTILFSSTRGEKKK
jgi:hypothetical protein